MKPEIKDEDIIIRQVPAALPTPDELTDDQLENVIGGSSRQVFDIWCAKTLNEWRAHDASEKI